MGLVVVVFSLQLFKQDSFVRWHLGLVLGSSHISEQKGKNKASPWITRSQICLLRKSVSLDIGSGGSPNSQGVLFCFPFTGGAVFFLGVFPIHYLCFSLSH